MLFSYSSSRERLAALFTIVTGLFTALTPMAARATGTVTLAWDASTSTNVIANYKLYYGVAPGTYTSSVAAGTALTASVSNLVEGATYYFAATAVDTDGLESAYSAEVSALIPIKLTNQPPTLNTIANLTINENASEQIVSLAGITAGAANESQTLTVTASSSNTGLIPTPTVTYTSPNTTGSLRFTPVAYANGTATITVTVNDGGASNNITSRSFTVKVNSVNQAPTLDALANLTINENASQQTVSLTGIGSGAANESQTLTVTAASSNTGVIPVPTVTYTSPNTAGSIRFTPVANAYGSATVTVTVSDGGLSNNVVSRSFTVTVNQVNQAPTITSIANTWIGSDSSSAPIAFTIADTETAAASLTLSSSSDNTALVPLSGIVFGGSGGSRTVTVTPAAGQTGVANITITVSDGTDTASSVFQLSVRPRPSAPGGLRIASVGP